MGRGHGGQGGHGGHGGRGSRDGSYTYTDTTLDVTTTDNGYEATIEDNSTLRNLLTLDDVTGTSDAVILNLTQADGSDQYVSSVSVEGIESVDLNITVDDSNDTDDTVVISRLSMDDTTTLNIISEESIQINRISASSLETVDLTAAESGFTINHTHSTNGITYLLDTIGDGVGILNYDADSDGEMDTSVSSLELNFSVQDILEFSATSLENTLLVERAEVGTDDTADIFDLSALGVTSIDELTFTDGDWTYDCVDSDDLMITSDAFDGALVLSGVTSDEIDAANFIFA